MFRFLTDLIRSIIRFFVGSSIKEHAKTCSLCTSRVKEDSWKIQEAIERKDDSTMRFVRENEARLDALLKQGENAP
jgi:hypothetical protein